MNAGQHLSTVPTMFDFDPTLPKWTQIYDVVRERIESGEYPPKSLVSEVKLEAEFSVTRTTIRKVTARLREEGLIVTRPSLGSFVTEH